MTLLPEGPRTSNGRSQHRTVYRRPSMRVTRYTPGRPKVVVLHEHAYVGDVLHSLLDEQAEVAAETTSGAAAVALGELLVPDVVVAGELLADGVIDQFAAPLLQTGARILVVAEPRETARLVELAALGVTGVVDTDQSPDELARAVLVLAAGAAVLPPDVVSAIAAEWRRARRTGQPDVGSAALTTRELEVLDAMADGMSAKAIGHHLGIAVKTVENHKTRIFDKLGVRTQAQAVARVLGGKGDQPSVAAGALSGET